MNRASDKLEFAIKIEQEKAGIRREILAVLNSLRPEERQRLSAEMLAVLHASPAWRDSQTVLLFCPLRSEPDLAPLLECDDHKLILPRVTADGLALHRFDRNVGTLRRSPYGILEPDPETCPHARIAEIDLTIVPGLAFDPGSGIRIGRGGGYYDRLLADAEFSAMSIGATFGFQLRQALPSEAHDQPVDALLTESGLRSTRAASARTRGSA